MLPQYNAFIESSAIAHDDRSLVWCEAHGFGYYPVDMANFPYDENYLAKYQGYEDTDLGRKITDFRVELVNRYIGDAAVVDIGIGSGAFIRARGINTFGFDVNPFAIAWLTASNRLVQPLGHHHINATFWDSLEHLVDPRAFVIDRRFVFVSIPIFTGLEHVLRSKHYRPKEHFWYFTRRGLVKWFERLGFECLLQCSDETKLGREDIGTFVFRKRVG